jgi:sugar-phosphatase
VRYGLDADEVYRVACGRGRLRPSLRSLPTVIRASAWALLHELEDEDVRSGVYAAFDSASELLHGLPPRAG